MIIRALFLSGDLGEPLGNMSTRLVDLDNSCYYIYISKTADITSRRKGNKMNSSEHNYTIVTNNGTPEGEFAQWVINTYDQNTLDEWIMALIDFALHNDAFMDSLVNEWWQSKVNA